MKYSVRELLFGFAAISCVLVGYASFGLLGASPVALAFGLLLFRGGHQTQRSWMVKAGLTLSALSTVSLSLSIVGWFLFDIGPIYSKSSYPPELTEMARLTNADFSDSKIAGLGSFIDSEHVWRLSLPLHQLQRVVGEYELTKIPNDRVPKKFWQVFPLQWRPTNNNKHQFYTTLGFPYDSRGPDGEYYFVMYDGQRQYLYVWHKFNF